MKNTKSESVNSMVIYAQEVKPKSSSGYWPVLVMAPTPDGRLIKLWVKAEYAAGLDELDAEKQARTGDEAEYVVGAFVTTL